MNLKRVLLSSLCFAMSLSGHARIPNRGSSTSVATRAGAGDHVSRADAPPIGKPGTIVSDGSSNNCRPNDTKGYLSQSFLRNITDPNVPDSDVLRVVETTPGVYEVKMDKYFSACTKLEFEVRKVDSNYFVRVRNKFKFNESNVYGVEGEHFKDFSDDEKYYRCLKKKGMLSNGGFDWGKAEQTSGIVYGTSSQPFGVDIGEGHDSVSIYYASPLATEYPKDFPAGNIRSRPSDWGCTAYENFNQKGEKRLFTSHRDQVYDRAMQVCQTQSAEKILEELSSLRGSSAGNFLALEKILEQAFDKAQEKRVGEIYKRMAEIEDKMKDKKDLSRGDIKDLGGEYSKLALELNKIVIQPSMKRVETLLKERKDASDKRKEEIDKKIKKLNDKIARFSNEHPDPSKGSISKVYARLKEQGLVDDARNIEGLRLASHFYGRVYDRHGKVGDNDKRGRALTMRRAEKEIRSKMSEFERKELHPWEEAYAVKNGETAPLSSARRDVQSEYTRMQRDAQTFQQNEYKYTMQYCGSNMLGMQKNPYRCNQWQKGQQQRYARFQTIMGHHQSYINMRANNYQQYNGYYNNYLQNNQNREPSSNSGFAFYGSDAGAMSLRNSRFMNPGGSIGPMSPQNYGFVNQSPFGTSNLYNMGMPNMSNSFMMR